MVAKKICFEKGTDTEEGLAILRKVKEGMGEALYEMEAVYPQSKALSAGTCLLCGEGNCTRALSEPCRYPDKMRYSIESLGGNVGLTVSKLMGIQLEWIEEGKLPSYFVLVGGLLKK